VGRFCTGHFEIQPDDAASTGTFFTGFYEREVTMWCLNQLRTNPPTTLIDIGANFGYYPLLFGLQSGGRVRSIAFEPEPSNYAWLLRNIALNPSLDITAVNSAVGDTDQGTVPFATAEPGRQLFAGVIHPLTATTNHVTVNVPQTTVDSYLDQYPIERSSLVMIDVEGYEQKVVDGMSRSIDRRAFQNVILEFHPWAFADPEKTLTHIVRRFESAGYHGARFREEGLPKSDKDPAFYRLAWQDSVLGPVDCKQRGAWEHYVFTLQGSSAV